VNDVVVVRTLAPCPGMYSRFNSIKKESAGDEFRGARALFAGVGIFGVSMKSPTCRSAAKKLLRGRRAVYGSPRKFWSSER